MDTAFRKIDIDAYDEDVLDESELYEPDPRPPAQVLSDTRAKAQAVRGQLAKWVLCRFLLDGGLGWADMVFVVWLVFGIYELDVDNVIWQDISLDDEAGGAVPDWLGDENVRSGIRLQHEMDRCQEEEKRLEHECHALQQWFTEEWACLLHAEVSNGKFIYYIEWLHVDMSCSKQMIST